MDSDHTKNPELTEDCSICQEFLNVDNTFITPCNHKFHIACLTRWFVTCRDNNKSQSCPLCRRELPDILNEMDNIERDEYLNYSDAMGIDILYNRTRLILASSILESLWSNNLKDTTGMDISGFSNSFQRSIDASLSNGEDLFALQPETNKSHSLFNLIGKTFWSMITTAFTNRIPEHN
jgi:hypothetical protein